MKNSNQGLYKGSTKAPKSFQEMDSIESAANIFCITQAEEIIKQKSIKNKKDIQKTNLAVGLKVREAIKDLGNTMPEDLPKITLSSFMKRARLQKGWSQAQMARMLKVSATTISDIEQNRRLMKLKMACDVAKKLKYSLLHILTLWTQDLLDRDGLNYQCTVAAAE